MTDTDHCFPLSSYLSACCIHASIIVAKDKETHWSSKKLKTFLSKEHKTLKKNTQNQKKLEKKGSKTVNSISIILQSPSIYLRGVLSIR